MKYLLYSLILNIFIQKLSAQDYFYTPEEKKCKIELFNNGKIEQVTEDIFINMPLQARALKRNPEYLGFTYNNKVYISRKECFKLHIRTANKLPEKKIDEKYIELEAGINNIADRNQVPMDYNLLMPSIDPALPTSWGQAQTSSYKTKSLFQVGYGIAAGPVSYYAFKFRFFKGEKTDNIIKTDVNSGLTQTVNWNYSDNFYALYFGYKVALYPLKYWKINIGGYMGVSQYASTLTDGVSNFKLASTLLPVFMGETGLEYRIEAQTSLGFNLQYEYLGTRTITLPSNAKVKTRIDYSNSSATLFIKYYY